MIYRRLEDHILLRSHIIKITSLFGFKRILGVDRSSRLDVFCKNICMGVSFLMKWRPASLQLYQNRRSDKFGFLWVLRNFLKNIFYNFCWTSVESFIILLEPLRTAASLPTGSIFVFFKTFHFPFFHQSWNLKMPFENVSLTFSWINVSCSIFSPAFRGKLSDKYDSASYRNHICKTVVGNCIPSTLPWKKISGSYVICRVSSLENKVNELNVLCFIYKHHTF